ncbi:MAG TPA: hypothetical protein VEB42_02615, partial [Chitinophagaceae bacterium]|nr:hypothetical protein [Chitinophagaceae bacterium]
MVPTLTPFSFHCQDGEFPPFTAVALKLTGVPGHIAPEGNALNDTDGCNNGFTTMVTGNETADKGVAQKALEVSSTVTTSVFDNVDEENTGLLVP